MICFLTGDRQAGKTSWLRQLIADDGMGSFSGFMTPAIFENDRKTGIGAMLLPSGIEFPMAKLQAQPQRPTATGIAPSAEQNPRAHWDFSDEAMDCINAHLAPIDEANPAPGVFVVDELGPLEMIRGEGLMQAVRILDGGFYSNALVVMRPELLDVAIKRWGPIPPDGYEVIEPGQWPSFM